MTIHWNRIIALVLAVFVMLIFMSHSGTVRKTVASIEGIGPGHSPDEQTFGLLILGLLCVTVVALVKIATQRKDD